MTTETEQELINNKFEFIDWVFKNAMKRINAEVKKDREKIDSYMNSLQKKYESVSESIRKIHGYAESLKQYEKTLDAKHRALSDRNNNLQNIYNKMLEIEKRLNSGEWPGTLPPINFDLESEIEPD